MSTLQEIRDKVRTQADLDEDDLGNPTLDEFILEAFQRTFAVEERWPFFEYTWTLTKAAAATTIDISATSPEIQVIQRVRDADGYNLVYVSSQIAEDRFQGTNATTANPTMWSRWGDTISLWPTPTSAESEFTVRGYRKPTWSGVASTELDGDDRLHLPIFHYAVALAYAQMEDPELEAIYMQRWGATLEGIRRAIMRPQHDEPSILNGGVRLPWTRPSVVLDIS